MGRWHGDLRAVERTSGGEADLRRNADAVMRPGAAFYVWHADTEGLAVRAACEEVGWPARQCLIWAKNVMVMGRQDYHWKHEPCLYGWKPGAAHQWLANRKQTTVLEFDRPARSVEHPTMKPVALFEYLIRNSTREGQVVLDLFGGSGSTLIAAERAGRIAESDGTGCAVWGCGAGTVGRA